MSKSLRALVNVEDYRERAQSKLPQMIFDFYAGGADDQLTLVDNVKSFQRIQLRPKVLIDVSSHCNENSTNCQTKVLNSSTTISFPCIIAPTALHRLAHKEHGELATVRAAVACSTVMIVSTTASIRIEQIADEHRRQIEINYPLSTSELWYQMYVLKNRDYSRKLIERAEKAGYRALVLTVDHCELGNREMDVHNNFTLPDDIQPANLIDESTIDDFGKSYRRTMIDPALCWQDIQWIRSITSLPLIVKGIIHPDDARQAVQFGVQGIVVSNHGGRQLDTCLSTIDALTDVVRAVRNENSEIDVYVDGGVRRGTDILKAVALGAKAVLVGRPVLWGLAVEGEQGVENVLGILRKEFRLAMMLCGCRTVNDIIKNDLLVPRKLLNQSKL